MCKLWCLAGLRNTRNHIVVSRELWCLAGLRNTRNHIVPREHEYLETDSNNRQSRSSGESEIATRMPGTSGPSDASCSSRCHLANVGETGHG